MSAVQADRFASRWRIVTPQCNDPNGLSATVFENVADGKLYFAIRGTDEFFRDVVIADGVHIALLGTPLFQGQFQALRAKVQEWIANGILPQSFTVAGHSLGGFLATGLAAEFSTNIDHAYLYNAPGLNGILGGATAPILRALEITAPVDPAKISNIKARTGISPIAGLGSQVAPPIKIEIEDQFLSDVPNPPPARNHSQQVLTDALAVYALIERLKPGIPVEEATAIIKAASSRNAETLEGVVNRLAKVFGTATASLENREQLYNAIYAIEDLLPTDGTNPFRLVSLVGESAGRVANAANAQDVDGLAYRYALRELNPFVVLGVDYSVHNAGGVLDRYDPVTGNGLTQTYLADRAAMLGWFLKYNTADGNIALRSNRIETYLFENKKSSAETDVGLTVVGRQSLSINNPVKIVFGSEEGETITGGDVAAGDRLYGGGGDDILDGQSGNDYLEGGAGGDSLTGGAGDDWIEGDSGGDILSGDAGNDVIYAGTKGTEPLTDISTAIAAGSGLGTGLQGDWLAGGADVLYGNAGLDTFSDPAAGKLPDSVDRPQ
ncbi:MAG TPA: hypothetical protein VNK67_02495 [Burkholderiales bacterium]|nr:hypothetical protein [Burkholderiales bacterium]